MKFGTVMPIKLAVVTSGCSCPRATGVVLHTTAAVTASAIDQNVSSRVVRNACRDRAGDALLGGVAAPQIAAQRTAQPVQILDHRRLVEAVCRVQGGDRMGAGILTEHHRRRAAQQLRHSEEQQRGNGDCSEQHQQHAAHDQPEHVLEPSPTLPSSPARIARLALAP